MNSERLRESMKKVMATGTSVFIWGPPGIGKSEITDSFKNIMISEVFPDAPANLKKKTFKVMDIRTCTQDIVDIRGVPSVIENTTRWNLPDFFPNEPGWIIKLDEFPQAHASVMNTYSQLILDKKVADYTLPEYCPIVAIGNRMEDRCATHKMPSHLSNRFVHLNLDVDTDSWVKWALNSGVAGEVIGFIRFKPGLLFNFDPKKTEEAFASPRAWKVVSDLLNNDLPNDLRLEVFTGVIGNGPAIEFCAFLRDVAELPDIQSIIDHPETARVPEKPSILFSVVGALASKANPDNIENIITYADRLPSDFSILLVIDSTTKGTPEECIKMTNNKAFVKWSANHKDVIL